MSGRAPDTARKDSAPEAPSSASANERVVESASLLAAATAFAGGALAALVAFRLGTAPIAGPGSIGQFAAVASAVVALPSACAGRYLVWRRTPGRHGWLDHVDVASLAVACAVVALFGWTLLAGILAEAFVGAVVYPIPVVVLGGVCAAITAYGAFATAAHLDARRLALLFAAFFLLGVLASAFATSDPDWWEENLSALGVTTNASARAFNVTLVVSGVLVVGLARLATRDIAVMSDGARGVRLVRASLVVIGVFLALVGVFPVDAFFVIHVAVSLGMLVAYAVLVVRLPAWVPGMPAAFVLLGRVFLGVAVVVAVFYLVGYYTLTAVELIAGGMVFAWLVLFIRNTAALAHDEARTAVIP